MTSTASTSERHVALDLIDVPTNVRELDPEHVAVLAASIKLRGLLVPLIVRPVGKRFKLVAGFHRHAACRQAQLTSVPVVEREQDGESADRAAENVVRKQLTPLEEARAVAAMLEQGYTPDGAATILGWAKQRVTARAKILELPEAAQELVGSGAIPVGGVDALLTIAAVSPKLCALLADVIAQADADGHAIGAELARDPSWLLNRALSEHPDQVWAAYLNSTHAAQLTELRLGKKSDALLAEAEQLHRKLDRYAYGPPTIRFSEADVDQARAAGVLLELGRASIILDRALYRELVKGAIARTVEELRARFAEQAQEKASARRQSGARERSPRDELDVEHRAAAREHAARAHGVNLDLGVALLDQLASVDPADVNVARFFCLCGRRHRAELGRACSYAEATGRRRAGTPKGRREFGAQGVLCVGIVIRGCRGR